MHRLVMAETLVEAGLTLMTDAEAAHHRTPLQRAAAFRNGLMIALLACCPVRLKNFAVLAIEETLVRIENTWWIVLTPAETKEKRSDERPIPDILTRYIDRYVECYRKTLDPTGRVDKAVWVSSRTAKPMSYLGIEKVITDTTHSVTGTRVSHTCSEHQEPRRLRFKLAPHRGLRAHFSTTAIRKTTQQHYNRASSLSAGKAYLELMQSYLKP
jgi:hypothetical protein